MRRLLFSLLLCLSLSCGRGFVDDEAHSIVTPDGKPGAAVTCFYRNKCIMEISKHCTKGYTVLNETALIEMMVECKQ